MNGLELIENLRGKNSSLAVIILSCHDEFNYAQQAIRLGVHDYVLKETIQPDTIGELLKNVVAKAAETKASISDGRNDPNRSIVKERFIRSMLYHPIQDQQSWRHFAEVFGLSLGS